MRELVLDTETTGLDPTSGDRVVEIGCLELVNHIATGESYQCYINPERDMPEEAFRVHGLSEAFLRQHPPFAEVAPAFLDFIGDDRLVIHNADFDLKFLNAELRRLERQPIERARVVDTLGLARRRFPGAQVSLDALCRRFGVDNSERTLHGALLDCELLAEVYLQLRGGRQPDLALVQDRAEKVQTKVAARAPRPARLHAPSDEERRAHGTMLEGISEPIWRE